MVRRVPSKQRNARIVRENDRDGFLRFGLLLFCGLGVASGFVYAGRQHFAALNYGYDTESLRRERDQLIEEHHRYLLQREESSSPVRLERAARQLGMQPLMPSQIDSMKQPDGSASERSSARIEKENSPLLITQVKPDGAPKTQSKRLQKKPI